MVNDLSRYLFHPVVYLIQLYEKIKIILGLSGVNPEFDSPIGRGSALINGVYQDVVTRYQYVTAKEEYENMSFEELRMLDYAAGRRPSKWLYRLFNFYRFVSSTVIKSPYSPIVTSTAVFPDPPPIAEISVFGKMKRKQESTGWHGTWKTCWIVDMPATSPSG